MTTFTMTGQRNGQEISLTWEDGVITGEPGVVQFVRLLAAGYEGKPLGNSLYGFTKHNHLQSPYTSYQLMRSMFTKAPAMTGDFPKVPPPPEGAVQ